MAVHSEISEAQTASTGPMRVFAIGVFGIATYSMMDAAMKGLTIGIGVYNTMLWRSAIVLILAAAIHFWRRPGRPSREAMMLHIQRGAVSLVMALLFFWGLARVPMAQAISLTYIAPLIAILLAAPLLGERVGRASILGSLAASAGIAIILFGQSRMDLGDDALWGTLAILCSALCYSYNLILARRQSQRADPAEIAFWQTLVVEAGLVCAAPWLAEVPAADWWPQIGLAAVLAIFSMMLLAWAYRHGEASYLAPTEYTSFVWASLFGWLLFGEHVSGWTIAGAACIIAGCLYAARAKPRVFAEAEVQPT